jgi:hypothetical protein
MLEFDKEQSAIQPQFKKVDEVEPEKKEEPVLPVQPEEPAVDDDAQFDLFGEITDPKAVATGKPQAKKPVPKPAAPVAVTSKPTQIKPKEEKKVGVSYNVYYAGNTIQVPEDDMTLEELREFLQVDFPEFSKDRTELIVDHDKKEVRPIVKGSKKG